VTKFDINGNGVYSTFLGGAGDDYAFAIAADSGGNVFVTGSTTSTAFPTTQAALQPRPGGGIDAFVAKLSPTGTLVFSTYLGGSGDDQAFAIAVDAADAPYITGQTGSTDFPTANPAQAKAAGNGDVFVAKLNGSGASLVYSTYLGGGGGDTGNAIAVDAAGAAYLTGSTASTDFPLTDAFQPKNGGSSNAVVAALDPNGAVQFASYLGGSGSIAGGDSGGGVAVNCAAGLVVLGSTNSSNFPATSGVVQATSPGGTSAFIAKVGIGGLPAIARVASTASLTSGPQAPGSLISVVGSSLAGATITLNGNAITPMALKAGQADLQLPNEVAPGAATVSVANACGTSAVATFQVVPSAPYVRETATGDAAAVNQDGTVNSAGNPAKAGSVVVVSLTGIGPVDNPVATGVATPAAPLSTAKLASSATIGGWDTSVLFLGLTPGTVGWAQANLVIPGLSSGAYPVVITVGGAASNGATVYVQ
jgi:uncharacterized protein (TIGR03437 family)